MMRGPGTPWVAAWVVSILAPACTDAPSDDRGSDGSTMSSTAASVSPTQATTTCAASETGDDCIDGTNSLTAATTQGNPETGTTDDDPGPTTDTGTPTACSEPSLWCPTPTTTWQWQLSGALDPSVDVQMYDLDLFETTPDQISALRADGRVVVCYLSAGSHEDWRPDADQFPVAAIGNPLDGWPGERWLDIRDQEVRAVLAARFDLAVDKGCDGVEPDNVDGYTNDSGFVLTADDQLDFNRWLADQAHARGLSVGLKNDLDQVQDLEPRFDWAINEECMAYDECDLLMPFIAADKAVFHVEYVDDPGQGPALAEQVCPDAIDRSFSTLIKGWDLDAWRIACR